MINEDSVGWVEVEVSLVIQSQGCVPCMVFGGDGIAMTMAGDQASLSDCNIRA